MKYLQVMKIAWIKILISNINGCLYICLLKLKLDINLKKKKGKLQTFYSFSDGTKECEQHTADWALSVWWCHTSHPCSSNSSCCSQTPHCIVFLQVCNSLSEFGVFLPCLGVRVVLVCPSPLALHAARVSQDQGHCAPGQGVK